MGLDLKSEKISFKDLDIGQFQIVIIKKTDEGKGDVINARANDTDALKRIFDEAYSSWKKQEPQVETQEKKEEWLGWHGDGGRANNN